jgi:hypothetical protein
MGVMVAPPHAAQPASSPTDSGRTDQGVAPQAGAGTLHVIAWRDDVVEAVGFDPRSTYVERFWLPVLGPSATWLLRRLAEGLEAAPLGYALGLDDTAHAIGLGTSQGPRAPMRRAIERCIRFDVARSLASGTLMVRRRIAPLPRRHLARLPLALQDEHRGWEVRRRGEVVAQAAVRRARLLALDLTGLGEDPGRIERHLVRWGIDAVLAAESSAWARERHAALAHPTFAQSDP